MRPCHECRQDVSALEVVYDIFGAPYHPKCYIEAMPPYPGPGVDPNRVHAQYLASQRVTESNR